MELEVGLKMTHIKDYLTSTTDILITKDSSGPLFMSRETDNMFFLILHLKGFRREDIDIQINEVGNQIAISGKKPVQEMVLSGWIMRKKEVEMRTFKKVFRIPDGVILDKIKAKFNDEESTLTITMPKLIQGICGVEIDEVKDEQIHRKNSEEIIEEENNQPKSTKMQDIDQVVEKEVVRRYPETLQAVAEKGMEEETVESQIKNAVDQGRFEESKEVVLEKSKEPKINGKKQTDRVVEEKVNGVEYNATETAAGELQKSVGEAFEKEAKEPEGKKIEETDKDVEKSQAISEIEGSRESTKPPAATTQSEEAEAKREVDQAYRKEVLSADGTSSNEQQKMQESPEAERKQEGSNKHDGNQESIESTKTQQSEVSSPSLPQVEEKQQVEGEMPQKLPEQKSKGGVQEISKPAYGTHKTENHVIEKEEFDQEQNEDKSAGMENRKQPRSEEAQRKKSTAKKPCKLSCTLVAGSAILVSLVAIVIHFIRAKKR
ncbi:HSP20 domain-containing protein [Cephalotus follicularis]|uniref:HSP20 domain-containing protein n=1 Tax=Cephalotus follicularis TaxID=3775 RepID=A0A1Q3AWE6_CEPFO|nr:HSP20 domain-containing protein [Cephalotus follicularis]